MPRLLTEPEYTSVIEVPAAGLRLCGRTRHEFASAEARLYAPRVSLHNGLKIALIYRPQTYDVPVPLGHCPVSRAARSAFWILA